MHLKDFEAGDIVQRRYLGKRFFYVESEEDKQILGERCFPEHGAKIEFLPVGNDSGGGCNQVIQQVNADRDNQIEAYGILDRDALAACARWEDFFNTDDEHFFTAKPFGKFVHVLRCWEIENYLLHPELIEEFVADEKGRSPRSIDLVMPELFELACKLIPVVAGSLLLNSYGKRKLNIGFGIDQDFDGIVESVKSDIEKEISPDAADAFDGCVESVSRFFNAERSRDLTAWLKIIRCLDGKRLLFWIQNHYQVKSDMRWHLARRCKDRNLVETLLDQPLLKCFDA